MDHKASRDKLVQIFDYLRVTSREVPYAKEEFQQIDKFSHSSLVVKINGINRTNFS